ncbi:nuclear transport factor 2 family protein [Sphingobacterium deserti]|uniref:DUF4878 domain-containing protein n=1 Tax=Sphingobacterium deserti TaxID=1229276 RepID=A0A0B8T3W2_9SPHI|nr:nuclear transport factor 2 family protein [Sphingobacterium deserti]KGE15941.1 hypothetical protein DI53_0290 [Sphingobacterium deserti]
MKKTLTTIIAAFILITSFSAFAVGSVNPIKKFDAASIIGIYLESAAMGNPHLNKYIFADDFEYRNSANNDSFSKKEYMRFLKQSAGAKFDCQTVYEILDQSGQACVAKATMTFPDFVRVDYVTLNHSQDGWKVSKIVTTYP